MKLSVPTLTDAEVAQIVKPIYAKERRERVQIENAQNVRIERSDGRNCGRRYLLISRQIFERSTRIDVRRLKKPKAYTARFNYTDWLEVQRRNAYVHIVKDDIFRFHK